MSKEEKIQFFRNKGNSCFKDKNFPEAIRFYKRGLELDEKNPHLNNNVAQAYLEKFDFINAEKHAKIAILINKDSPKGYYRAARASVGQGQRIIAIKYLKEGIRNCTDATDLREYLDTLYGNEAPKRSEETLVEELYDKKSGVPVLVSDSDSDDSECSRQLRSSSASRMTSTSTSDLNKAPVPNTRSASVTRTSPTNATKAKSSKVKKKKGPIEAVDIERDQFLQTLEGIKKERNIPSVTAEQFWIMKRKELQSLLKEGSEVLISGLSRKAVENYKAAIDIINDHSIQDFRLKEIDFIVLKYALCIGWIELANYADIAKAVECLTEIEENRASKFPAVFYGLGSAYYKLNRFKRATEHLEKGLLFLSREVKFEVQSWPGTNTVIPETTRIGLEEVLRELLKTCRAYHEPDAVCRYKDCQALSTHIIPSENIFYSDPDFCGFVIVICEEKCRIEYHVGCWKEYKETTAADEIGKLSDKDFIGRPCPTTDCLNQSNERSVIVKIEIIGDDTTIKASIEAPKTDSSLKESKKSKKKKAEKSAEVIIQEKPKVKTRTKVKKNTPETIQTSAQPDVQTNNSADELVPRLEKLKLLRSVNFGYTEENTWNPSVKFYGRADMKTEDTSFGPEFFGTSEELTATKEFVFSYFYEYIKNEGPQKMKEVERKWNSEASDIAGNGDFMANHNNICSFLLQSYRFASIDDYICLAEQLPDTYCIAKTELCESLKFTLTGEADRTKLQTTESKSSKLVNGTSRPETLVPNKVVNLKAENPEVVSEQAAESTISVVNNIIEPKEQIDDIDNTKSNDKILYDNEQFVEDPDIDTSLGTSRTHLLSLSESIISEEEKTDGLTANETEEYFNSDDEESCKDTVMENKVEEISEILEDKNNSIKKEVVKPNKEIEGKITIEKELKEEAEEIEEKNLDKLKPNSNEILSHGENVMNNLNTDSLEYQPVEENRNESEIKDFSSLNSDSSKVELCDENILTEDEGEEEEKEEEEEEKCEIEEVEPTSKEVSLAVCKNDAVINSEAFGAVMSADPPVSSASSFIPKQKWSLEDGQSSYVKQTWSIEERRINLPSPRIISYQQVAHNPFMPVTTVPYMHIPQPTLSIQQPAPISEYRDSCVQTEDRRNYEEEILNLKTSIKKLEDNLSKEKKANEKAKTSADGKLREQNKKIKELEQELAKLKEEKKKEVSALDKKLKKQAEEFTAENTKLEKQKINLEKSKLELEKSKLELEKSVLELEKSNKQTTEMMRELIINTGQKEKDLEDERRQYQQEIMRLKQETGELKINIYKQKGLDTLQAMMSKLKYLSNTTNPTRNEVTCAIKNWEKYCIALKEYEDQFRNHCKRMNDTVSDITTRDFLNAEWPELPTVPPSLLQTIDELTHKLLDERKDLEERETVRLKAEEQKQASIDLNISLDNKTNLQTSHLIKTDKLGESRANLKTEDIFGIKLDATSTDENKTAFQKVPDFSSTQNGNLNNPFFNATASTGAPLFQQPFAANPGFRYNSSTSGFPLFNTTQTAYPMTMPSLPYQTVLMPSQRPSLSPFFGNEKTGVRLQELSPSPPSILDTKTSTDYTKLAASLNLMELKKETSSRFQLPGEIDFENTEKKNPPSSSVGLTPIETTKNVSPPTTSGLPNPVPNFSTAPTANLKRTAMHLETPKTAASNSSFASTASAPPPATKTKTGSSYQKLMAQLHKNFPTRTEEDLAAAVSSVREKNDNSLSGLTVPTIISMVDKVLKEKATKKQGSMGLDKFGTGNAWGVNKSASTWSKPKENTEDECVICIEPVDKDQTTLNCKHTFHSKCIRTWLHTESVCPVCRVYTRLVDEYPPLS